MFLPFSLILSTESSIKSIILICSVISHWLGTFWLIDWMIVCFKPILYPNAWFHYYQNVNPVCLIMLFFIAIFALILNKDWCFYQSTIHFENHYAYYYQWPIDHLLNIHKWWWLQSTNHNQIMVWIGLFNNDSKLVTSNNQEDWIW